MSVLEGLANAFKKMFPLEAGGWQTLSISIGVLSIVGVGALATLWDSFRDALSDLLVYLQDFLKADLQVWHLLLVIVVSVVIVFLWARSQFWPTPRIELPIAEAPAQPEDAPRHDPLPREVDRFGVRWPMTAVIDVSKLGRRPSRFYSEKPTCPKDQTPLGWIIEEGEEVTVALPEDDWREIKSISMLLKCFECGDVHDLRNENYGMARMTEIVEEIALGRYRTALATGKEAAPR